MAQDQKGARATSAWLVFFDESAISLSPVVRRTWAPRGQTPTLRHRGHWKRASMAAALGYRSDASGARLCFHVQKDSYNTVSLIGVLEQLKAFYQGQQVVLLGDGLGRTGATSCATGWRASRTGSPSSGCPPTPRNSTRWRGCGPTSRTVELANFAGDTVLEVADQAQRGIERVCASEQLVVGFLAHTGLTLDEQPSP